MGKLRDRKAQMSSSPQEGHSETEPNNTTQTHLHHHNRHTTSDRALSSSMTDGPELQASQSGQDPLNKPNSCPEILSEKYLSKDRHDGSKYPVPCIKSLQKTDPLFQSHFGPNLKHVQRQRSDCSNGCYDNEDNFVACQDLTSRSSHHLQHLERTLLSLSPQCRVLRGSGGSLRGCVTGLCASGEVEFYYHPQAAAFSQHYAQLQHLLEHRAQLLFLHEYARRCRAANCFITRSGDVLRKARLLASRGQSSKEQANSSWYLDLRAMCEELQVHIGHWDVLYARVRSDPFLRTVLFRHTEMLRSMQRGLWSVGQQSLLLMENCMHTVLKALASTQLVHVPRDALEDMLSALEMYNHVIAKPRSQKTAAAWSLQFLFTSDSSQIQSGLPRKPVRRGQLLVVEIIRIVAWYRAQIAARQFYSWTCQQTELLSLAGQTSIKWQDVNCSDLLVPPNFDQSKSILDESMKKPIHSFWSSGLPLFTFANSDREDILETLFKVLVSSTDLLAPHIIKRQQVDRSASAETIYRASGQEKSNIPKIDPSVSKNTVRLMDQSNVDACVALFSQYRDMLWRDFGTAVIRHFYYPSHDSSLNGVNQWNDHVRFLLVRWLKHACKEDLVPPECKDVLNKFCSHILSTAAFMHWDAIMCESLGLGVKDKCLPRTMTSTTMKTTTMELVLQLFPPLLSVLQLLQTPHTNLGEKISRTLGLYHLGLLCRTQTTVQSSTFWVMSKAYQFLSSWSLTKFVLVTQGDLKALKETVESLIQQLNTVDGSTDHLIMEYGLRLSQAISQLQAFSELVLRIFSMDCKKMSREIFEQTMPSAKHWRVNCKTELPSSPGDYAAFAAQSVLGQVFEGVQPLPDEARIPALTQAITAFMEAWMEHILKQKIKFSVHGALQLKQDFDLIRQFIRSEKYSLSEELHHQLLSLRVFHQVDRAIVCLLQQPVAKPYMPSQRWEPFRRCCPKRAQLVGQAVGSLNNLETIDNQAACHQALTQAEGSVSPELLSTPPPDSYLAVAQQEWLDLRIHTSSRWRIPRLRCFTKSEP